MIQNSYNNTPSLYLIPTPIGNLDDITYRAVKVLEEVEVIFSEDTRVTLNLLNNFGIKKKLISLHEHNENDIKEKVLDYLKLGFSVGLVTDRGTPIISDPGYKTVKYVSDNNFNVIALPGATAFVCALIASGMDTKEFIFLGFLPLHKKLRKEKLQEIEHTHKTIILYEAPHKLATTLQDLKFILGDRQIVIARELTKIHEEFIRGTIEKVIAKTENIKGEMVIIIEGAHEKEENDLNTLSLEEHYKFYEQQGLEKKEIIKKIAKDRNVSKNEIYQKFI